MLFGSLRPHHALLRFFSRAATATLAIRLRSSRAVSIVQLGNVLNGTGGTVQVTFVTFLQNGTSFTLALCGDQTNLFPLDQTVSVDFNPGQPCATVIVVAIVV
jgi:hypothetical protein